MKKIIFKKPANKRLKFHRKSIRRIIRLPLLIILTLIIITSLYTTITAFQTPTTTETTIPYAHYTHRGNFYYTAYLKNNTVYNTDILFPGEGTLFKKIIDHINGTFTYQYTSDYPTNITGIYTVRAELNTDLWTKTYTLHPQTTFTSEPLTIRFPINTSTYETITTTINEETGVTASNPTLTITIDMLITQKTDQETTRTTYTPAITIPLNKNIIEIQNDLSQPQTGSLTLKTVITQQHILDQQLYGLLTTTIAIVLFTLLVIFTRTKTMYRTPLQKQVHKIKKKYGEWIVELTAPLDTPSLKQITLDALDDLIKTSEELGKPILHYHNHLNNPGEQHVFYIVDGDLYYQFTLK